MKAEIQKKIQMVEEFNKNILPYLRGVKSVEYHVFVSDKDAFDADKNCFKAEYVVVTYVGDAIAARDCSGNSCSAIIEEISKLLDGGYYEEVNAYSLYKKADNFIDVFEELKN